MASIRISLNPSIVARTLGAIACVLVLASVAGQLGKHLLGWDDPGGLVTLFFVDQEYNIPNFFSVLLLLFSALLLTAIASLTRQQKGPHVSKWVILSIGFTYIAYDEAFRIHEQLIKPVGAMLGDGDLGIFYFAWVIPGIAVVLLLALFFLRFLLQLPEKTRRRFLIAAALYVGGAIGVELIGGRHAELYGMKNLAYSMITTAEESLEMAGLIVFIWALLKYFAENYKEVFLGFEA